MRIKFRTQSKKILRLFEDINKVPSFFEIPSDKHLNRSLRTLERRFQFSKNEDSFKIFYDPKKRKNLIIIKKKPKIKKEYLIFEF